MTTPLQMFEDTIEDHCDEVHEAASEAAERLLDMTQARALIESASAGDVEAIRGRLRALFVAAVDIAIDMAMEDAGRDGYCKVQP